MSLWRGEELAKTGLAHPCPAKPIAIVQCFNCVATLHCTNEPDANPQATQYVFLSNWSLQRCSIDFTSSHFLKHIVLIGRVIKWYRTGVCLI